MCDNIRIRAAGEVESDPESARTGVGVTVRHGRDARKFENRTVLGTASRWRWNAWLIEAAAGFGVNVPSHTTPLAWRGPVSGM